MRLNRIVLSLFVLILGFPPILVADALPILPPSPPGLSIGFSRTVSPASDWPTFKQNAGRTGFQTASSSYPLSELTVLWNYSVGSPIQSSPALADLNGNGELEVVFGSDNGVFYALDSHGRKLWSYSVGDKIRSSPTVADLDGDKQSEVLFGADDGVLYVLDSLGNLLWTYKTNGSISTSPLVANFDDTPEKEVVVTSTDGILYALDYKGKYEWSYKTLGPIESSPAAGDVNKDGKIEVIFGSDDNIVYAVSFPPYKVWQYQTNGNVYATPAVLDYDSDYKVEAIVGSTDAVVRPIYWDTASSTEGKKKVCKVVNWKEVCEFLTPAYSKLFEEWNYSVNGKIYSSPSVADFTGHTVKDIVFGTDERTLYIVDAEGKRVGGYTVNKAVRSSPAIADLDGKKIPEIIFGSDDGGVYVVDYPYVASISTIINSTESFKEVYDGLTRFGGKRGELASEIGVDSTIKTISDEEWEITKTINGDLQKKGGIKYDKVAQEVELRVGVGARFVKIDARKTKNRINIYDYPNKQRYHFQTSGPVRSSPAVGDINNDGQLEFLVGSDDGMLYTFGSAISFIRHDANKFMTLAEEKYAAGDKKKAADYISRAVQLHGLINDSAGLSKANSLIKRLEADQILIQAQELYNKSFISNASDYLTRAAIIYSSINYTKARDETSRLSDLLEAELYYQEASVLYTSGDFENASKYAVKAKELFLDYNNSQGVGKSGKLFEIAVEHRDADSFYVKALNLFFDRGFNENVTKYLETAKSIYLDLNDFPSVALVEFTMKRIFATKLTDDAYVVFSKGDIGLAHEIALNATQMFREINYTAGLYRAEVMVNMSEDYIKAQEFVSRASSLYSAEDFVGAMDYAQSAKEIYLDYNDSKRLLEVEDFVNKSKVAYLAKVSKPRYLMILAGLLVGIIAGVVFIIAVEKIIKDRKKAREEKPPDALAISLKKPPEQTL